METNFKYICGLHVGFVNYLVIRKINFVYKKKREIKVKIFSFHSFIHSLRSLVETTDYTADDYRVLK